MTSKNELREQLEATQEKLVATHKRADRKALDYVEAINKAEAKIRKLETTAEAREARFISMGLIPSALLANFSVTTEADGVKYATVRIDDKRVIKALSAETIDAVSFSPGGVVRGAQQYYYFNTPTAAGVL